MENDVHFELIDRFLEGELTGQALADFEQKMTTDEDLMREVQLQKEIREAVGDAGLDNLEAVFAAEGKKHFQTDYSKSKKVVRFRRWWLLAAAVAGIIFGLWYFLGNSELSNQKLYAEYAQHDFAFTQKNDEKNLNEIEQLLKAEKWGEALPLIEKYLENNPNEVEILCAKGICFLELEDYQNALIIFKSVAEMNPIYERESLWYQALTYLKKGDLEETKRALQQLLEKDQGNENAQNLLRELR